jgi:hypothetical protein
MVRKLLLLCGVLASLVYVGADIIAAMSWEGYSYIDQARSELSALGAPTRDFMVAALNTHSVLVLLFAGGIWLSAGNDHKRSRRLTAIAFFALGIVDLAAHFFPMHVRGTEGSPDDTMHIMITVLNVLCILLAIGLGALVAGKRWLLYSLATLLLLVGFAVWSFIDASRIAANLPTPWLGVKERISIYGYFFWQALLAVVLWRAAVPAAAGQPPTGIGPAQLTPR